MKHSTTHKGNTMQITLNQAELKDAVRLYVTSELKMDLSGKTLTTTFTATRGDLGIITNLNIEAAGTAAEIEIPGYTAASPEVIAAANAKPSTDAEINAAAANSELLKVKAAVAPTTEAETNTAEGQAELQKMKAAQPKPPVEKGTPAPVTVATLQETAPIVAETPVPATVEPVAVVAAGEEVTAPEVKPAATTSLFG